MVKDVWFYGTLYVVLGWTYIGWLFIIINALLFELLSFVIITLWLAGTITVWLLFCKRISFFPKFDIFLYIVIFSVSGTYIVWFEGRMIVVFPWFVSFYGIIIILLF